MEDFREHLPRQGNLGHLERNIAAVADDLYADLDHILPQRGERSVPDVLRQGQCPLRVISRHRGLAPRKSAHSHKRSFSQTHHLAHFAVVPYLQNIAIRVAEVYGVLGVAPGPERFLSP